MNFYKFPSIEQFRHTIKHIHEHHDYKSKDNNDKPIYEHTTPYPTLTFTGTVKLHGTNSSFAYDKKNDNYWCQSRNRILTLEKDNANFCKFINENVNDLLSLCNMVHTHEKLNDDDIVVLYGEWCGLGIQNKVAISKLDRKIFVLFDVKIIKNNVTTWISHDNFKKIKIDNKQIYNILDFQTFSINIDFNNPLDFQNKLADLTLLVEKECPVAKQLGVSGIGEGIVWTHMLTPFENIRFKVKGQEHSVSKVTKLANVDVEKLASINAAVDMFVTENRMEQGVQESIYNEGREPVKKNIRYFLKWMNDDIVKEESDTIKENGLMFKDIAKYVSRKASTWYMSKYI